MRNRKTDLEKHYIKAVAALKKFILSSLEPPPAPDDRVDIEIFGDELMGIRIAEVSIGNNVGGGAWMRATPEAAAIILYCEEFLLYYGEEPTKGFDPFEEACSNLEYSLNHD